MLIKRDELLTKKTYDDSYIVPSLANFRDLDRGKPFVYDCGSHTACFGGLPASTSYYVAVRGVNQQGAVSTWNLHGINTEDNQMQFTTQRGSDFTLRPLQRLWVERSAPSEAEAGDFDIDPPTVSVEHVGSQYNRARASRTS